MTSFTTEAFQNEYLPMGATDVHAVVTVGATGAEREAPRGPSAEIIMIDVSGSMDMERRISSAKAAAAAAIDCIRDGVYFAVIAGTHFARSVYPGGTLAVASDVTRRRAKRNVAKLRAGGGTAMGTWLTLAARLFRSVPDAAHHAILLTDGKNETEGRDALGTVLALCEGKFQCDCRGVGTDWEVGELRAIASHLLGTVDIVADREDMADDFRRMMQTSMGKAAHDVALRVWTPRGAAVSFVRQVAPVIEDLTDRRTAVDDLSGDYPIGSWGEETRDYHVCITVPAREVGDEVLAARVSVVANGEIASQSLLRAIWTGDEALSTRINREVAHYTGQAELARAIQDGLDARRAGDDDTATTKLGLAVRLAAESGNGSTLRLLAKVVDVEDAPTGTVRLKRAVDVLDEMTLDTRSTVTARVKRERV